MSESEEYSYRAQYEHLLTEKSSNYGNERIIPSFDADVPCLNLSPDCFLFALTNCLKLTVVSARCNRPHRWGSRDRNALAGSHLRYFVQLCTSSRPYLSSKFPLASVD